MVCPAVMKSRIVSNYAAQNFVRRDNIAHNLYCNSPHGSIFLKEILVERLCIS